MSTTRRRFLFQFGTGVTALLAACQSPAPPAAAPTTAPLPPAVGLIPYQVNAPLWSDGADKERYLAIPDDKTITLKLKEPYGLVVCIVPWNYPLLLMSWKVAPALMAWRIGLIGWSIAPHTSVFDLKPMGEVGDVMVSDSRAFVFGRSSFVVRLWSFVVGHSSTTVRCDYDDYMETRSTSTSMAAGEGARPTCGC